MKRGWLFLIVWLGLIGIADWLFYDAPLGCNLAVAAGSLLAAVAWRYPRLWRRPASYVIAALTLGLIAALAVDPGPLVSAMTALGLVTLAIGGRAGWRPRLDAWARGWLHWLIAAPTRLLRDLPLMHRWLGWRRAQPNLSRWLLPALLAAAFIGCFAYANPVVDLWLHDGLAWLQHALATYITLPPAARCTLWLAAALAIWGLLRVHYRWRAEPPPLPVAALPPVAATAAAHAALLVRCLILLNLVFAVENALDLRYLWAGAALPAGITAAAYAHRGAYPLVGAALLAAALVLLAFRPGAPAAPYALARRLVVLWLAQTVMLTLAATWRLWRYVEVYTLTRWRLAAAIWMCLVALGLVWIVIRIVRDQNQRWLVNVNAATLLAVLYLCCLGNFDGLIARYNVHACREMRGDSGPALDLAYLTALGPAALPAVTAAASQVPAGPTADDLRAVQAELQRQLREPLRDWRGWTLRRAWLAEDVPAPLAAVATSPIVPLPSFTRQPARPALLPEPPSATARVSWPTPRRLP